jgi:hypothetical protein
MAASRTEGDELLAELKTTNGLLRLLLMPTLRKTLEEHLGSPAERRAYELADGTRTTREIANAAGASIGSVSTWSKKWRAHGVALELPGGGAKHVMSLTALGIEVPKP